MENNFEPIVDAYQLTEGSVVKGKEQEELFQLGEYDEEKKGYTAYPYDNGQRMEDFPVLITETELMDNYLIESQENDDEEASDDGMLSDSI
ncbi:MAG: hypothetical protein ACTHJ8_01940 [Mucilaginibacter sp.]|jgi:hypothetical protein